ncbi:regulatory CIII domain protein [Enterobacter cloacae]|nr:regulatory CIII domain protein [Enterobacter cloacae]
MHTSKQLAQQPLKGGFFTSAYQQRFTSLYRYAITHNIRNPTMTFAIAGGAVVSAYYPTESELSKRVRRLIRAASKHLEGLCHQL